MASADYDAGETFENVSSPLSDAGNQDDDADYEAGETSENVSSPRSDAMKTTMADDFGLDAFYIISLNTRPSCDNEVNPLLFSRYLDKGPTFLVSLTSCGVVQTGKAH
ncbi:unnamed protein product [Protopolystoma xenopodis]|uniref:Uncharacterized protein n=1 Tax=Protopolystoma xenopodis TaxID=117903 RepID=A0A448WTT4_9PLAT|nr:unnamed protein product [Protopolystoma xenopodis]